MDVYGLIGNPVGHSVSPPMHEAAYEECDLDARYVTFEPSEDSLAQAISGADALGIRGLNVTIPYKQTVLPMVEPDPVAARIGAINTIAFNSTPEGYNTDAAGVRRAFEHHDISLTGKAVIVGAGGAGRATAHALADEGVTIQIANRTYSRASELATELQKLGFEASSHELDELSTLIPGANLLVNTTSVGMDSAKSPVPRPDLHDDLAVMDAVYTPLETKLLKDAREVGATCIDGAWMLLYQGVEAFEIWTGIEAPIEVMNRALRAHLE